MKGEVLAGECKKRVPLALLFENKVDALCCPKSAEKWG
ncbi:hypothetical protein SLEP1_g24326 [Rubroshorea leprosula]|uniref:Uncharacterized protein n=1 Tax=Rubroshorea leprosula TaxID=152421 RepID=A0AAV5JPT9_9ROSI|nr:hypothetical protein SLEP1_g24326 [Rubroshorea leprosula]